MHFKTHYNRVCLLAFVKTVEARKSPFLVPLLSHTRPRTSFQNCSVSREAYLHLQRLRSTEETLDKWAVLVLPVPKCYRWVWRPLIIPLSSCQLCIDPKHKSRFPWFFEAMILKTTMSKAWMNKYPCFSSHLSPPVDIPNINLARVGSLPLPIRGYTGNETSLHLSSSSVF